MICQKQNHPIKPKTITSKIVKNEQTQLLMKYGQAYFPLRSIDKTKVSQRINTLLDSYPCWFMKESLMKTKEFSQLSKHIISADPKQLYVFEENLLEEQQITQKFNILSSIDGIKFTYLKVLHIMLVRDNSFEEIGWLNAPLLEQLYVSSQKCFTSIRPLQKSCFNNLYMVNFRNSEENQKVEGRMFDLHNFHRTRLLSNKYSQLPKAKFYTPPGTISIFRNDLSNINIFAKLQISRLTNFHIPHLPLSNNQYHRFSPDAKYPWCPQLQFCQCKIYNSLNQRFDNKTIALSIVDYVLDQEFDYERGFVRRNFRLDEYAYQEEDNEGEEEGGDSDLDQR